MTGSKDRKPRSLVHAVAGGIVSGVVRTALEWIKDSILDLFTA